MFLNNIGYSDFKLYKKWWSSFFNNINRLGVSREKVLEYNIQYKKGACYFVIIFNENYIDKQPGYLRCISSNSISITLRMMT